MLKVNEVSKKYNIPKDTLRYYEKIGILKPTRLQNQYRVYDDNDILRLKYIQVMKYAKFPLEEIKIIMSLMDHEPSQQCKDDTLDVFYKREKRMEDEIKNYQNILHFFKVIIPMITCGDNSYEEGIIDTFISDLFNDIYRKEI